LASVCINDCHECVPRDPAAGRHAERYRTGVEDFFFKMLFFWKIYPSCSHREWYGRGFTPVHRIVAQYPCYYWHTAHYCGKKGNGTEQHVSPQAMPGILLIILGIVLGSDRLIGYAFLGAGVIIAIFDAVKNRHKK